MICDGQIDRWTDGWTDKLWKNNLSPLDGGGIIMKEGIYPLTSMYVYFLYATRHLEITYTAINFHQNELIKRIISIS